MAKKNTAEQETHLDIEAKETSFKSRVSRLSTKQKMLDVSLWTNRLDRRLKLRLADFKLRLSQHISTLKSLEGRLTSNPDLSPIVSNLVEQTESVYKTLLPEIVELSVVAADHVYYLDSLSNDYKERYKEIESRLQQAEAVIKGLESELDAIRQSKSFRLGHYMLAPLRLLKENANTEPPKLLPPPESVVALHAETPQQPEAESRARADLKIDVTDFTTYNPFSSVNNKNSGFAAFDSWATFYRHDGKAYGCSKNPSVSDHLDQLIEFHEAFSFKDKNILELGSFEAGNTKQMLDLGAKKVVGIEANREFYLKCCLVKNEFQLNRAEFIYGNCLEVLEQQLADPNCVNYDICWASGILYHFEDPLQAIDLITRSASIIYVWTQYASEEHPSGEWLELSDDEGRVYKGRSNTYSGEQHWGGVAPHAVWLADPDIERAFKDRGFDILNTQFAESHKGKSISFIAERR